MEYNYYYWNEKLFSTRKNFQIIYQFDKKKKNNSFKFKLLKKIYSRISTEVQQTT